MLGVVSSACRCGHCAACAAPAAMITTIGVSYILFNIVLLTVGADVEELPEPAAAVAVPVRCAVLGSARC